MKISDLEQEIMRCWAVVDDVDMLYRAIGDSEEFAGMDVKVQDKLMNITLGLHSLYEMKFQKMFNTFEEVCKEYHTNRIKAEELEKQVENLVDHAHRQALK